MAEPALRPNQIWLAAQKEAFQFAMNGAPLQTSLGILIDTAVEHADGDRRCAFYIANADGTELRHVVGMPDVYAQQVDGFVISPESLSCGLAVATGEPVITPDVLEESRWQPWTWLAREHDFRGCWSFPVETATGKLVGSLAMYFKEPRTPTASDRELAAALTQTAAIIISRHQETEERSRIHSERARAEAALRESETGFRQFGEASSDILWVRDANTLQWEYLSPAFESIYGIPPAEILQGDNLERWAELIDAEDRERTIANLDRVRAGERITHEFRIRRADGETRWIRDTDFPLFAADGRVQRIGGIGQDVTEEKESAERMQVMVSELQHRTRNLIAVVRSIAAQTMAVTGPTDAFREQFNHRLDALARVQGLLSRADQEPITIQSLVRMELGALGATEMAERIHLDGPPVRIRHSAVQTLALALHELATNARKYGALSAEQGRLNVTWRTYADKTDDRLSLEWLETGGNGSSQEASGQSGYGRELIERALPYSLNAKTSFALDDHGLRCTIDMPLNRGESGSHAS